LADNFALVAGLNDFFLTAGLTERVADLARRRFALLLFELPRSSFLLQRSSSADSLIQFRI
jgi:hypothetical protein